jgi:apolipoprotein N-acyltransferase
MGNDRLARLCLATAAGTLAGLALPPLGLPPLQWLALALLWNLAARPETGRTGPPAGGLLWGMAAVLASHRWLLWLHPLDWIGVPPPLSLPLCLLLWALIGLLGGLLVAGWLRLVAWLDPQRPSTALLAAALWGLAEVQLAAGPLFWIGLGGGALPGDPALAGLAAWLGAGGLASLQLLIGWTLWRLAVATTGRRGWLLVIAILLTGLHLAGAAALAAIPAATGPAETLLVLQPAIPTRRKFEADAQLALLRQLAAAQRAADGVAGSLLLPEGSLPLGQPLPQITPVEVLSGGFRRQGQEQRSSLLRFAPQTDQPVQWLDKHRLVPLGEWVPFGQLLRWGGLSAVGGLQAGPASRLLPRPTGPVAVAICYELADGRALAEATRQGARWLLASANLDPYPLLLQQQFTALARLRAIENGRWLVSAANTGPSLVVDATGALRQQLPAGRSASALVSVEQRTALTPYARWGELPLLALALLGGLLRLVGPLRAASSGRMPHGRRCAAAGPRPPRPVGGR